MEKTLGDDESVRRETVGPESAEKGVCHMSRNGRGAADYSTDRSGPAVEAVYRVEEAHCWINAAHAYAKAAIAVCDTIRIEERDAADTEVTR
jgi:hypothetical protein